MDTQQAYNQWASQYDTNKNRTRDLEALALRQTLSPISFNKVLEIGCGTGKNTVWFAEKVQQVTAVDLSVEMLAKAKEKVKADNVEFKRADITTDWNFTNGHYDLVGFSLVLEHIENLDPVFKQVAKALHTGGHVYVGELHPFKQYAGTKARFETEEGLQVVPCFNHHVSDFINAARNNGLAIVNLQEYFDEEDKRGVPRILALLFRKAGS
jgi:ubiquinone/menaquinone biosynthesis C-methylase UbiE